MREITLAEQGIFLLRIVIAGILGLIIGKERSSRQKEAGLRTHFIVAAGSALIMCVSMVFVGEEARIAAQIVSGIGFLGAGMIFFRRENLHGLTTAAGVWATAGIGMATGVGLYLFACGATVIIVVVQYIFHNKRLSSKENVHLLMVKFDYTKETVSLLKDTFNIKYFSRFKAVEDGNMVRAEAVIRTYNDCSADLLSKLLTETSEIHSIERLEDL